jgi:protein-disulfide isomerase-like protein with CxxC motif
MAKDERRNSAADLLSEWRAAERSAMKAKDSTEDTAEVVRAAAAAEKAAAESEEAVDASLDAVDRAKEAAGQAAEAADRAAEVARTAREIATEKQAKAGEAAAATEAAEAEARERFRVAQASGFPKGTDEPPEAGSEPGLDHQSPLEPKPTAG